MVRADSLGVMEALGWVSAVLIGLSLGLIGGGGSILTVPVLVYFFGVPGGDATAFSLAIVGVTALVAATGEARRGVVDYRVAFGFAVPSVVGVYLMRRVVIPALPSTLFHLDGHPITKDSATLVLFGVLMLAASFSMIRDRNGGLASDETRPDPIRLGVQGFITGLVTGSVGAGGGFLIVPALILVAKIPVKRAVATSLMIIAVNSLIGFAGDLGAQRAIDWPLIGGVTALAVAGSFLGRRLGRDIPGAKLKPGFGYFILAVGLFVIGGQLT